MYKKTGAIEQIHTPFVYCQEYHQLPHRPIEKRTKVKKNNHEKYPPPPKKKREKKERGLSLRILPRRNSFEDKTFSGLVMHRPKMFGQSKHIL